jgi:hypothetical protein
VFVVEQDQAAATMAPMRQEQRLTRRRALKVVLSGAGDGRDSVQQHYAGCPASARADNSMANAEKWAASVPVPGYAIDDQTAIKVTDGAVEVVSEGHWKLFTP